MQNKGPLIPYRFLYCTILVSLLFFGTAAAQPLQEPASDEQPAPRGCTALRDDHIHSLKVPVDLAYTAQECPFKLHGLHDILNKTNWDSPLYSGVDWKNGDHGNNDIKYWITSQYNDYWYSRTYLSLPFKTEDDAKVLDANLKLKTMSSTSHPKPIFPRMIMQEWSTMTFGDPPETKTSFAEFPQLEFRSGGFNVTEGKSNVWVNINMTDMVQRWFDGEPNYGVCLRTNEGLSNPTGDDYSNSFHGTTYFYGLKTSSPPELVINYVVNQPPECQITSETQPPVKEGTPLTFTATASDPDGDGISVYEWSTEKDGVLAVGPGLTSVTLDNISSGFQKLMLRVRDDVGPFPRWSEYDYQFVKITGNIPEISEVLARDLSTGKVSAEFSSGDRVEIVVTVDGGVDPVRAWVNISYWSNETRVVESAPADTGLKYIWDTEGLGHDVYRVDVDVMDDTGEIDVDGLNGFEPDLLLVLVDSMPPSVESIKTASEGEVGESFPIGSEITVEVQAANAESDLDAYLTVSDPEDNMVPHPGVFKTGTTPGTYVTTWDTGGLRMAGEYRLEITLEDSSLNQGKSEFTVRLYDDVAPYLATVRAFAGSKEGCTFPVNTAIIIQAEELSEETGLSGTVDIEFDSTSIVYDEPLEEMGDGRYYYKWITGDLDPGWYAVNITLTDEDGNSDMDGMGMLNEDGLYLPDMWIELTVPPAVQMVLGTIPFPGSRDVPVGTMVILQFEEPVEPETVTSNTIITSDGDGNAVVGSWLVDGSGRICRFAPDAPFEPDTQYIFEVTSNLTTIEGVPAAPYELIFETARSSSGSGESEGTVEAEPDPEDVMVLDPRGDSPDSVTFEVKVEEGVNVMWSLNDRRIQDNSGPSYTFTPENGNVGMNTISAMVGEHETVWTVFILNPESHGPNGEGTEGDDSDEGGTDEAEEKSGDGVSPLLVGTLVFLAVAILVNVLFFIVRRKEGPKEPPERGPPPIRINRGAPPARDSRVHVPPHGGTGSGNRPVSGVKKTSPSPSEVRK